MKQCPRCQQYVEDSSAFCNKCGYNFNTTSQYFNQTPPPMNNYPSDNAFDACGPEGKSRGVAAILDVLLGGLGIHYFYLGKVSAGIITILLTLVTCGCWEIVMLIQGILMFCMTNEQFRNKYVTSTSTYPLF